MTSQMFVYLLIEAILFLMPIAKLWFQIGSWKKEVDQKLSYAENEIKILHSNITQLNQSLGKINDTLIIISTKVDLLVAGKLRHDKDDNDKRTSGQ